MQEVIKIYKKATEMFCENTNIFHLHNEFSA